MKISIIAAFDKSRAIGKENKIPWNLPADRKRFKNLTLNKTIIMGRKTYESIGHPLPSRRNIVITKNKDLKIPGCEVFTSTRSALNTCSEHEEVMIIGGANLYKKFLPLATTLYLTIIEHVFKGDVFFPEWNPKEWRETERDEFQPDDENNYHYAFVKLQRSRSV